MKLSTARVTAGCRSSYALARGKNIGHFDCTDSRDWVCHQGLVVDHRVRLQESVGHFRAYDSVAWHSGILLLQGCRCKDQSGDVPGDAWRRDRLWRRDLACQWK